MGRTIAGARRQVTRRSLRSQSLLLAYCLLQAVTGRSWRPYAQAALRAYAMAGRAQLRSDLGR